MSGENISLELAKDCWGKFNRNLLNAINSSHIKALQSLSQEIIEKSLTGNVIVYNQIKDLMKSNKFNNRERGRIKKLYSLIKDSEFSNKLLEMAIIKNEIFVSSVFGGGLASCKESIYLNEYRKNFLRFIDGNETFYLIQHKKVTGIYFPTRNAFIRIASVKNMTPEMQVRDLNREIVRLFDKVLNRSKHRDSVTLYGVLVSYVRPFHYFTELLPALHNFRRKNDPKVFYKIPKIISFEEGMFYSIKNLYSLPCDEQVVDKNELNDLLLINNGFTIHPSYNYSHSADPLISDLNKLLIDKSINNLLYDSVERENFEKLKDCYPLLWFGVCGEKRSWIEQIDGIAMIVREVHKLYPDVGVVLDGLTSTAVQNETQFKKEKAKKDIEVSEQIIKRVNPSIPVFNLIGSTSAKKIAYASQIDFFLTGYGTDSMYVARICRKHGVGHINNIMNAAVHKHPFTYKIQGEFVKDILNNESNEAGTHISYSIKPENVCSIFMEKLQNFLSKKSHHTY